MEVGGQAADQMAKLGVELTEESIKLLASGSKNLTAFLLALAKDNKKLIGRTSMQRLLTDGKPLKVFRVREEDFDQYKALAKQYGILYAAVKDKSRTDGMIDLVSNVDYVAQINRVMEVLGYPVPDKEAAEVKNAETRTRQELCSPERGSTSTQSLTTETDEQPAAGGWFAALGSATENTHYPTQHEQTRSR
jgi:hypothetical protein